MWKDTFTSGLTFKDAIVLCFKETHKHTSIPFWKHGIILYWQYICSRWSSIENYYLNRCILVLNAVKSTNHSFHLISDPPQVSIQLGKSLVASDIREGVDVYFDCMVSANPTPKSKLVTWLHNVSTLHIIITIRRLIVISVWIVLSTNPKPANSH